MPEPWSERQRAALRAFCDAIAVRARREEEIAVGTAERTREADQDFGQVKDTLHQALTEAQTLAQARFGQSCLDIEALHEEGKQKANAEFTAARHAAVREYLDKKR